MTTDRATATACDFCGLPVGQVDPPPQYCCYGCRLAAQLGHAPRSPEELSRVVLRIGLATFLSMNVLVFSMVLWTRDVYGSREADGELAAPLDDTFRFLCLLLALPVLWLLGGPLAASAWGELRRGRPSTDVLLLAGVAASYLYSAVSTFLGTGHVYFEVACVVLVLVTLGRWLEALGRQRTASVLNALARLLPERVTALLDGTECALPLADVRAGHRLRVRAGERVPVDGRVEHGCALVDEHVVTGESRPATKEPGDAVHGGTLDLDGDLVIAATGGADEGALARLIAAVTRARLAQGRYQRLAQRAACWLTPLVAVVALGTLAGVGITHGVEHGLLRSLAVVLIACPCALGLATPLAVWSAMSSAAQAGVTFQGGEALERLAQVRVAAFDKTGTLTTGEATVADLATLENGAAEEPLARAAALGRTSPHPFSVGLAAHSAPPLAALCDVRTLAGRGLVGDFADVGRAWLGNSLLMREAGQALANRLAGCAERFGAAGLSTVYLGYRGRVQAVFAMREALRSGAADALNDCRALGLEVVVLTGDSHAAGRRLAEELGVPVASQLLPDAKADHLTRIAGRHGPVAMVGDGVNDAPALAASACGIALGCGTDLSRDVAQVCLLGNDLRRVPWSIALAQRTLRVVRQNLFWAVVYNAAGIVLAAGGWLNPIWAAVAMTVSGLMVTGNSLRLAPHGPAALDPRPLHGTASPAAAATAAPAFHAEVPR
jgi:heavy metal translocating P-type ATPase